MAMVSCYREILTSVYREIFHFRLMQPGASKLKVVTPD